MCSRCHASRGHEVGRAVKGGKRQWAQPGTLANNAVNSRACARYRETAVMTEAHLLLCLHHQVRVLQHFQHHLQSGKLEDMVQRSAYLCVSSWGKGAQHNAAQVPGVNARFSSPSMACTWGMATEHQQGLARTHLCG